MTRIVLPVANGFYLSDSLPVSAQECTNWRPNILQAPTPTDAVLFATEGVTQLASTGNTILSAGRGAEELDSVPYFVNETSLFRLVLTVAGDGTESFSVLNLGTI